MRKFKIKFRQPHNLRNLLVMSLLSFVVALPILGQPLGLLTLWSAPAVTPVTANSDSVLATAVTLNPADVNLSDSSLNRSQSEYTSAPAATAAVAAAAPAAGQDIVTSLATAGILAPQPSGPVGESGSASDDAALVILPVDYTAYVEASVLNIRDNPNSDAAKLARLEMGDKVKCIGEAGDWLVIQLKDQIGFVRAEFISQTMVFVPASGTVYVKSTLNLRKTFGAKGAVMTKLAADSKLSLLGVGDGWSRVRTTSGKIGYVASGYLTSRKPKVSSSGSSASRVRSSSSDSSSGDAPSSSVGDRVVYYAKQALGTPYVYGGESLSGMDCSGLVYWCYKKVGISVPRSSGSYGSAGVGVSLANIEPGDVICLDTKNDGHTAITHLAIYVGGGRIIHASSGHDCVRYSTIATMRDCGYTIVSVRRISG